MGRRKNVSEDSRGSGYTALANGIVIMAVKDYRKALRRLGKDPGNTGAGRTARECERFFRSEWFTMLTDADGVNLMQMLRKENGYDGKGVSVTDKVS